MFIGEISNTIRREVVYGYLDGEGAYREEKFFVWVKRLSFREKHEKSLVAKFEALREDTGLLADAIAPLIHDWELYADKGRKEKCEITAEFIGSLPPDLVDEIGVSVVETLKAQDPKRKPANSANGSEQAAEAAAPTAS